TRSLHSLPTRRSSDLQTFLPIALRAWAGLVSHVNSDGMLGYAQKQGAAPAETDANTSRDYAQGAFLLAGGELYKMNIGAADIPRSEEHTSELQSRFDL